MKNYFVLGVAAMSLLLTASCSKDTNLFDAEGFARQKEFTYQNTFNEKVGTPNAQQGWGFEASSAVRSTRGVNANANQWEDQGWVLPEDVTPEEIAAVRQVFDQKGAASYESLVDWSDYFVVQIFKGTAQYYSHAPGNAAVTGSEHMDWLCTVTNKHENVISWWPKQVEIVEGAEYDDHINNFNNGNCTTQAVSEKSKKTIVGTMLMVNTNTNKFGFKSSEDNGHVFYNFRMEKIGKYYYVGFDFEADGQNPNEQIDRDYIYNDWIVRIVPGKGMDSEAEGQGQEGQSEEGQGQEGQGQGQGDQTAEQNPVVKEARIMCEDLGAIGDFDFNDVVFDAKIRKDGTTEITLLAAGGTLELTVAGEEVHEKFGVGVTDMVNTGKMVRNPVTFTAAQKYTNLIDIPIIVRQQNGEHITSFELTAEKGKAPQKICVPVGTKWPDEYVSIAKTYPNFVDGWVKSDDTYDWNWTSNCQLNLVDQNLNNNF